MLGLIFIAIFAQVCEFFLYCLFLPTKLLCIKGLNFGNKKIYFTVTILSLIFLFFIPALLLGSFVNQFKYVIPLLLVILLAEMALYKFWLLKDTKQIIVKTFFINIIPCIIWGAFYYKSTNKLQLLTMVNFMNFKLDILLYAAISVLLLFSIISFLSKNAKMFVSLIIVVFGVYFSVFEYVINEIIPANKSFKFIKSQSYDYLRNGGIFDWGDNKYLIFGGVDKNGKNTKKIYFEIFDGKKQKISRLKKYIEASPLYFSSILSDKNIFIYSYSNNNDKYDYYFGIIDTNTFELNNIKKASELFGKMPLIVDVKKLDEDKILISDNRTVFLFNYKNKNFEKLSEQDNYSIRVYPVNSDKYIKIKTVIKEGTKETEICSINEKNCKKFEILPNFQQLIKLSNNKILIIDKKNNINIYDINTNKIELITTLPREVESGGSYTLLQDGNILLTGDVHTGWGDLINNSAYIIDAKTKSIKIIDKGMKYGRKYPLTKLLDNGNVLICGTGIKYSNCEIYQANK